MFDPFTSFELRLRNIAIRKTAELLQLSARKNPLGKHVGHSWAEGHQDYHRYEAQQKRYYHSENSEPQGLAALRCNGLLVIVKG